MTATSGVQQAGTPTKVEVVMMPEPLGLYAGQLFDRASEYLSAFEILTDGRGNELPYASYFLLTHSVELFLKSYLAAKGISKKNLKSHSLPGLFANCQEHGIPHVEDFRHIVRDLHEMNKDHDFRYPTNYNLRVPPRDFALSAVVPLRIALSPIISSARVSAEIQWQEDVRHLQGKKIRWSD